MADNQVTLVEKNIAFKIANQFPAYFREYGPELVDMVEQYYRFVETDPKMGVYNSRRMFEYRDVGTTLSSMIIFFKKKYMSDLPPIEDDTTVRFLIRNIMDLYRRKGTESGLRLFFRMFYEEDIIVRYPSQFMFKPSDSKWRTGTYLQLYKNHNSFYNSSKTIEYTYADLLSKDITGSISKATAIVDKINFVYLNSTLTPIVYLVKVKGNFTKYDDILARFGGEDIAFGKLNGSASSILIDPEDYIATTGNNVGDIFNIKSTFGTGGKAIVTKLVEEFTGTVDYKLLDGGFGYTIPNTKILSSNQVVILDNDPPLFEILEVLVDTDGNEGTVIGQNSSTVGIKMEPGEEFAFSRAISTRDRTTNITLTQYNPATETGEIFGVAPKNDSAPGPLYANTGNIEHAKVEALTNIESISLITDIINPFTLVPLNSSNFNANPPAAELMSGSANPVTLATPMNQAFDLTPFDIGTIESFENINPGEDYINDTFTLVLDEQMIAFERYEQVLLIADFNAGFSPGDTIYQGSTNTNGIITKIDNDLQALYVRPFSYYGFKSSSGTDSITYKGSTYDVLAVERDYTSKRFGESAIVKNRTLFSQGKILEAEIRDSGFAYVDGEECFLVDDDGKKHAKGILSSDSQGITAGFWGSQTSHINGFRTNVDTGIFEYYDSKRKIQDSDFYQEYSYEIRSTVAVEKYEKVLKDTVHLAGTKMFGNFIYNKAVGPDLTHKFQLRVKDDYIVGGSDIVGPNQDVGDQTVRADTVLYSVDSGNITSDNS